jgi:hypothetical protein
MIWIILAAAQKPFIIIGRRVVKACKIKGTRNTFRSGIYADETGLNKENDINSVRIVFSL